MREVRRCISEMEVPVKVNGWLLRCASCKSLFIGHRHTRTCSDACRKAKSRAALSRLMQENNNE